MDEGLCPELDKDDVERLCRWLGPLDPRQVAAWWHMSPARRLELAFQAHQLALDGVRTAERREHPDWPAEELERLDIPYMVVGGFAAISSRCLGNSRDGIGGSPSPGVGSDPGSGELEHVE